MRMPLEESFDVQSVVIVIIFFFILDKLYMKIEIDLYPLKSYAFYNIGRNNRYCNVFFFFKHELIDCKSNKNKFVLSFN